MTEDVLISVRGYHMNEEKEEEEVEIISPGKFFLKNGKRYLFYEEIVEGIETPVHNTIKISEDQIEVKKKGPYQSEMIFEENVKHNGWYVTPFGKIMSGTEASEILIRESEHLLEISISYELEMNYEHAADCRIEIKVMDKEGCPLRLGE